MKLSKKELAFWRRHYRIEKAKDIPAEMPGIISIDDDFGDEHLFYITSRVPIIHSFDLENSDITDEGVRLISTLAAVKKLELKNSRKLTAASIQYIVKLKDLEVLNLMNMNASIDDLNILSGLPVLRALYLSQNMVSDNLTSELDNLQHNLPHCKIFLDYNLFTTNLK